MAEFTALFFDTLSRRLETRTLRIPASGSSCNYTIKITCADFAVDHGFTHWAAPEVGESGAVRWLVFGCTGRASRVFLSDKPTKEAAEMWLVHLG